MQRAQGTKFTIGRLLFHRAASSSYKGTDFNTLFEIVTWLCENGAHVDICNLQHNIAMDVAEADVLKGVLRSYSTVSLTFIAARVIKKHKWKYRESIPFSRQSLNVQYSKNNALLVS